MSSPLPEAFIPEKSLSRRRRKRFYERSQKTRVIDAATLAASIQIHEEKREFLYSLIALALKAFLFLIAAVSLAKLGAASLQRVQGLAEVSSLLSVETQQLIGIQDRFDSFYTIGGEERLMDEQDHWIEPNSVRVIWK